MRRSSFYRVLAVLVVLALAVPVLAKPMRATIALGQNAKLAGTQLKPGSYTVIADETKVVVKKGSKVVAEAPAKWAESKTKASGSSVILRGDEIAEIRIGGSTKYLVF